MNNYPTADKNTKQKAHDFLKTHPMGILSTVGGDGKPWGAAIYFVADTEFNFFFETREQTQKFKNIDNNSHVALTVADPDTQTTVQVSGTISRVPSKDIVDIVFKKLAAIRPRKNMNWVPPILKVHRGDWMILKLTPEYAQFANYQETKAKVGDDYIRTLL